MQRITQMSNTNEQITSFDNLGLSLPILEALNEAGYETPTPIQAEMVPALLTGRDVLGQAQTGTGKTAAFALPILEQIDISLAEPQALVLAPTRELALQVCESFKKYAARLKGLKTLAVYGGQDYSGQLRGLSRGAHIVVGTPGRVMDHIKRGTLKLESLRILVLDEADEMLRMGFKEDVEWILEQTPQNRQIALFSATIPAEIRSISRRFMNDPEEITIKEKTATVANTRQRYWVVSGINKLDALSRILEAEPFDAILIFARTKLDTVELTEQLINRGFAAAALNGDIAQGQRERIVDQLKKGRLNIIVATDVAARGLDVDRISHVINFDAPFDPETYVHRIGRTGRAGRNGEAILFLSPREKRILNTIERATRQAIEPMKLPSADFINSKRIESFKMKINDALTGADTSFFKDLIEEFCNETKADPIEVAAAAARLFQGDRPLLLKVKPEHNHVDFKPFKDFGNESSGRKSRGEKGNGRRRDDEEQEEGMERYRIEVGKEHGVLPGHIVGAIAGETGMASRYIGRIRLFNEFSTVDLPEGMPKEMIEKLKTAWICKRQLEISLDKGGRAARKRVKSEVKTVSDKKQFFDKKAGKAKGRKQSIKARTHRSTGKTPPRRGKRSTESSTN
jgi:ATP-dependent RNA helicase DeaD